MKRKKVECGKSNGAGFVLFSCNWNNLEIVVEGETYIWFEWK